ncbi:hypothetical protein [Deinococcus navajonensis]|uniref:Uncharacterized protein n=1 Tax=Deinococcus navajonensis TaxID=309884 RepID=A0ABV8XHK6_9DEIO
MRLKDHLNAEAALLRGLAREHQAAGHVYAAGEASRAAAGLEVLSLRVEGLAEWAARQAAEDHAYWLGLEDPVTVAAEWEAGACLRALKAACGR